MCIGTLFHFWLSPYIHNYMWTEPYLQSHTEVAFLYPSTFYKGYSFTRDYQKNHLLHLSQEKMSSHRLPPSPPLHLHPPRPPSLLPQLCSHRCRSDGRASSSQKPARRHLSLLCSLPLSSLPSSIPARLMDLTDSESWHLLQRRVCSRAHPASWQPFLHSGVLFNHKSLSDWLFQALRPHSHQPHLLLFRIKELITSLLLGEFHSQPIILQVNTHFCLCVFFFFTVLFNYVQD